MTDWLPARDETVTGALAAAVAAKGDATFLDFGGDRYSYRQIDAESDRMAHGLIALGVQPGDTVVSLLDNNVDAVIAWFGINKAGAISVPINTAYKGEFLRHQIATSGTRIVMAEAHYAERVTAVAPAVPGLHTLLTRGPAPGIDPAGLAVATIDGVRRGGDPAALVTNRPGDLSMLIYTSGTTGPSKACMLSHGYACNVSHQLIGSIGARPDDVMWTALPLFHISATLLTVLSATIVKASAAIDGHFSLSRFWPEIERSGATTVSLLGSMQTLIAEAPDTEASRRCYGQLRVAHAGPFPAELQEKWRRRFGVQIMGVPGYGLTEASMISGGPLTSRIDASSSGPIREDFEVILVDDEERPVAPGAPGEILCRPRRPNVMFSGYWNRPEDTLKVLGNLWLHTGDIGRIDENGELHFLDRKKDYLRRRGENISSFEVEATFHSHPDVVDVAAHAVFSEFGEDDLKITAVLREGASLGEAELCAWCIERMPYFAVPRYIEFRADLPRSPTGKVLKYQLREEGCTPATWDRNESEFKVLRR